MCRASNVQSQVIRWKKKLKSLVFEGLFCLQSVYIRSRAVFECFSHGLSLVRRIVKGIRQMTSENILARLRSGDSWQENLSGSCLRTWHGGNTKYIYIFFPSPIQYRTWLDVFLFSKRDFSQLVKNDRNSWFIFFLYFILFLFFLGNNTSVIISVQNDVHLALYFPERISTSVYLFVPYPWSYQQHISTE